MTTGECVVLDGCILLAIGIDLQYCEPIMVLIESKCSKKGHCSILTSNLTSVNNTIPNMKSAIL